MSRVSAACLWARREPTHTEETISRCEMDPPWHYFRDFIGEGKWKLKFDEGFWLRQASSTSARPVGGLAMKP